MWKARFHTHINSRGNSSYVYFKFYILKKAGKRKDSEANCSNNSLYLICSLFLHSCNFHALVPFQIFELCHISKRFIFHSKWIKTIITTKILRFCPAFYSRDMNTNLVFFLFTSRTTSFLAASKVFPLQAQLWPSRVDRCIVLFFYDHGTRSGWMVSVTPRPHFTPRKDPVPIVQEAGWATGPVWTGGKSRPTGIRSPDRPARSSVAIPTELPGPQRLLSVYVFLHSIMLLPTKLKSSGQINVWRIRFNFVSSWVVMQLPFIMT